jgi:peptide-methionine (S)-S-oxide reductase
MKILKPFLLIAFSFLMLLLMSFSDSSKQTSVYKNNQQELKIAYFASGCFWCVEAIFESVKGVEEAVSETVAVYYNPAKVDFKTLVKVFYGSHDPTTVNGQHPDYGSQYRSIAFYSNVKEKAIIKAYIKELNDSYYKGKIVTEVTELVQFYKAEEYHQNYEKQNPNNPYVKNVSVPRLNRFKEAFPELLKKEVRKH